MAKEKKNFQTQAASQKTSTHGNYSDYEKKKAVRLVHRFRVHGIPNHAIGKAFDLLLDLAELDEEAMNIALSQVLDFLDHKLPEPTQNAVINITVITIMGIIIESMDEETNNHINQGGKDYDTKD